MGKNLQTVSLLDILPEVLLRDVKLKAAAQALDAELQRLSADARLVLHLPRLDELPNEVLDELAYQYHVDFFRAELNVA